MRIRAARGVAVAAAAAGLILAILHIPPHPAPPMDRPDEVVVVDVPPQPVATQSTLHRLRRAAADAVALLVREIRSADGDRAEAAARLLASLGTSAGDAAAADLVDERPNESILRAILRGFLSRSDLSAERRIRDLLASDRAGAEIVALLESSPGTRAIPVLLAATRSDSVSVKAQAVRALASRSPSKAAAVFVWTAMVWGAEDGQDLAGFVADTLVGSDPRAIQAIASEIRRAIRTSPSGLRGATAPAPTWLDALAASLGTCGAEEAWPPLSAILEEVGPLPSAIEACGELGDVRAIPILERYLLAFNPTSAAAARALGRIRGRRALDVLLAGLRMMRFPPGKLPSDIRATRDAIAGALLGRREETIAALCENLLGSRAAPQDLAALIDLFPEDAVPEIARILFEVRRDVRPLLLRGLADVGTREAIAVLVRAMEDPRLAPMARTHLVRLTARDFGPRPESWRRWLKDPGTSEKV